MFLSEQNKTVGKEYFVIFLGRLKTFRQRLCRIFYFIFSIFNRDTGLKFSPVVLRNFYEFSRDTATQVRWILPDFSPDICRIFFHWRFGRVCSHRLPRWSPFRQSYFGLHSENDFSKREYCYRPVFSFIHFISYPHW